MTSSDPVGPVLAGAASALLAPLVPRPGLRLVEVARTRMSVHYETGVAALPVLCVATPDALRLPNTLFTAELPTSPVLVEPAWRITRWWRPTRPTGLPVPGPARLSSLPRPSCDVLEPCALVGRGAGLTPEGDDLLAAALVTAHATADPRLSRWRALTRVALATRRTTAVSRGLLQHALDGYAVPELADLLTVLCAGGDLDRPLGRLLAVGHSSGSALVDGVVLTLSTRHHSSRSEGAA